MNKINLDYGHGTGHGVGYFLNVHEGPQAISKYNNVKLQNGMILSNEPGYYEENNFGIRCENLILVKEIDEINGKKLLGFEDLTLVPFDQRLMNLDMLNHSEIEWINDYHKNVWKKIEVNKQVKRRER